MRSGDNRSFGQFGVSSSGVGDRGDSSLSHENKLRKVKLKVGGVTRTIHAKSPSDSASPYMKPSRSSDAPQQRQKLILQVLVFERAFSTIVLTYETSYESEDARLVCEFENPTRVLCLAPGEAGGLDFLQYLVFEDAYKSQLSIVILDDIERLRLVLVSQT